jgi:hypothetical protein
MDNYQHPKPGKTYISPALPAFGDKARRVRIASKVLPSTDGYEYVKERDEVVVRQKPDAATYIKAKFLEDTTGTGIGVRFTYLPLGRIQPGAPGRASIDRRSSTH